MNWSSVLEDIRRTCCVIALATAAGSDDPSTTILQADSLIRRVAGAAHVAIITATASRMLLDRVGPDLSLYRQAVRIYKPALRRVSDNPWRHLLWGPQRIAEWPDEGAAGFERWVASRAIEATVQGAASREERLPGFNFVRQAAAQLERKRSRDSGASIEELMQLFEEDNKQLGNELREQAARSDSLIADIEREHDDAIRDAQEAKALAFSLRERVRAMEQQLTGAERRSSVPIPKSLQDFEKWCQTHLSGVVEVHNRAINGAKKSFFRDPALIYQSLLLLRDYYVPMRRIGGKDRVDAFERTCRELGLDNSLVGEATQRYREEYEVRWSGETRIMNWHLKGGEGREKTTCFRLYYFWDEEAECVVVGSLPAHLRSDLT